MQKQNETWSHTGPEKCVESSYVKTSYVGHRVEPSEGYRLSSWANKPEMKGYSGPAQRSLKVRLERLRLLPSNITVSQNKAQNCLCKKITAQWHAIKS